MKAALMGTKKYSVSAQMAACCILTKTGRFTYSHKFSNLIPSSFMEYLETTKVSVHIGLNRTPFENVTPYPNRHKDLDNLCLYVFSSRFEKIPVDRIPSKDKTLHAMCLNA